LTRAANYRKAEGVEKKSAAESVKPPRQDIRSFIYLFIYTIFIPIRQKI
jgi:hypothetical protein